MISASLRDQFVSIRASVPVAADSLGPLRRLWSLIKVAALAPEIICVSARRRILKLGHLKQLGVILLLHLEKVLAVRVIMRHGTGSSVPARELSDRRQLLLAQRVVLLSD